MTKTISKDIPLAEITLRKYEKPGKLERRELIRKLCLSIGLLQPGDSRDVIVDILYIILSNKGKISSEELQERVIKLRKKYKMPMKGVAASNIRRQVKRLRDMFIVEKVRNEYRINENEKLINIFEDKIEKYYLKSIIERVKEYFSLF